MPGIPHLFYKSEIAPSRTDAKFSVHEKKIFLTGVFHKKKVEKRDDSWTYKCKNKQESATNFPKTYTFWADKAISQH